MNEFYYIDLDIMQYAFFISSYCSRCWCFKGFLETKNEGEKNISRIPNINKMNNRVYCNIYELGFQFRSNPFFFFFFFLPLTAQTIPMIIISILNLTTFSPGTDPKLLVLSRITTSLPQKFCLTLSIHMERKEMMNRYPVFC